MNQLENYHGSTNGIQYKSNENILFLIHKNDIKHITDGYYLILTQMN